jgi:hypothetical protein
VELSSLVLRRTLGKGMGKPEAVLTLAEVHERLHGTRIGEITHL